MSKLFQEIKDAQREAQNGPVDVTRLAKKLGLKVEELWMDDDLSGALVRNSDGSYTIQVNALHPPTRKRFTTAHELGHYVYHRSLLGDGVNDSRAYRTTEESPHYNPRIVSKHETQANKFAATLLMPAETVNQMIAEGVDVAEMAKRLGVSKHAMSIRAGVPYKA